MRGRLGRGRGGPGLLAGVDQLHTQLTKLGELRQAGLLTDEEFATQKARLLQS
ncbi:SHOCT domain-containing protein [Modestobacter marinus]|uniref:SHOCT domain-containing protein n=1 Tax=Modestobacter marinus TaxID=477641 RepID=UPI001C953FCA|nr:SHOCT domain-containing protein [Modestobacter marinus]